MTRSDHDRVADILDACRRLSEVAELGRAEYDRNWIVQSAVERQLEIIGEAASRLSEDFRGSHAGLPARQAKALRNVISHEYFSVNHDRYGMWSSTECRNSCRRWPPTAASGLPSRDGSFGDAEVGMTSLRHGRGAGEGEV